MLLKSNKWQYMHYIFKLCPSTEFSQTIAVTLQFGKFNSAWMWNTISQSECPCLYHLSKQRYSHWQQPYSPPYSSDSTFQCSGSLNCYGLWLRYSCVENTHHSMLTTNVTDKSTFTEGISVLAQLVELLDIQTGSPWIKSNQWYIGESCSDVVLGKFNQQYGRNDFTVTGLNSAWVTELCLGDWTLPGWLNSAWVTELCLGDLLRRNTWFPCRPRWVARRCGCRSRPAGRAWGRWSAGSCDTGPSCTGGCTWSAGIRYQTGSMLRSAIKNKGDKKRFYLTTHSTHFIYGYMASNIWLTTILIVRKETCCCHIGYSYRLTARVLLYAPTHRQDNTYHCLCYTSHGALAGTRNSSMGKTKERNVLFKDHAAVNVD